MRSESMIIGKPKKTSEVRSMRKWPENGWEIVNVSEGRVHEKRRLNRWERAQKPLIVFFTIPPYLTSLIPKALQKPLSHIELSRRRTVQSLPVG